METKRMGVIGPKAKTDQTTEARLSEARAELARIEAAIIGADREIDLQLLDGDRRGRFPKGQGARRSPTCICVRSFSPSGSRPRLHIPAP